MLFALVVYTGALCLTAVYGYVMLQVGHPWLAVGMWYIVGSCLLQLVRDWWRRPEGGGGNDGPDEAPPPPPPTPTGQQRLSAPPSMRRTRTGRPLRVLR